MISGFQREIYRIAHDSNFFNELFDELIGQEPRKSRIFDIMVRNFFHFNILDYVKIDLGDIISLKLVSLPYWDKDDAAKFQRYTTHFNFKADTYRNVKGSEKEDEIRKAWIERSKLLAKEWASS